MVEPTWRGEKGKIPRQGAVRRTVAVSPDLDKRMRDFEAKAPHGMRPNWSLVFRDAVEKFLKVMSS